MALLQNSLETLQSLTLLWGRRPPYPAWLAESAVLCQPPSGVQRLARGACFAFHHFQPLEHAHRRQQCCSWELLLFVLLFPSVALCSSILTACFRSGVMRWHGNSLEKMICMFAVWFRGLRLEEASSLSFLAYICAHSNMSSRIAMLGLYEGSFGSAGSTSCCDGWTTEPMPEGKTQSTMKEIIRLTTKCFI